MERRDFLRKSALAALGTAVGGTGLVQAFKHIDNGNKNTNRMKITVLTGSPRKSGNSACLAGQFIKGAEEKGHEVFRFDCALKNVGPCRACNRCGMDGPCVFKDDFEFIRKHIVDADLVAFATPMYYFGISTQIKAVIDRFYAINERIHVPKKAVLMMTYANTAASEAKPIISHYEVLLNYLGWTDAGQIIAPGVWPVGAINHTKYPEQAYRLGKNV